MHRLGRVAEAVVSQPASGHQSRQSKQGGHGPGSGRTAPPGQYYEEAVASSDIHRTAQVSARE